MSIEVSISRKDKLTFIGFPDDFDDNTLTDETIDNIYNKIVTNESKNIIKKKKEKDNTTSGQIHIRKPKHERVDVDSDKYKVTLNFLNGLLKTMNKDAITDITQFKNIKRDDLITDTCDQVLNEHIKAIIKQFGKNNIRHNMRAQYNYYVLTVIKYLTSLCGYQFISNNRWDFNINAVADYNYKSVTYYSIT